jgi:hypothetical protein
MAIVSFAAKICIDPVPAAPSLFQIVGPIFSSILTLHGVVPMACTMSCVFQRGVDMAAGEPRSLIVAIYGHAIRSVDIHNHNALLWPSLGFLTVNYFGSLNYTIMLVPDL